MQAVCNHNLKILDVFIGYPGSVHDSRVLKNSPLGQNLAEKCGQYFILGDSGYPLKRNLLTPYKDRGNLTRLQKKYNILLSKNRYVIEHCFGVLKQKFRQLYHIKLRDMETIVHMIRAACVLHNIALKDEFLLEEPVIQNIHYDEINDDDDDDDGDDNGTADAQRTRDEIMNSL